MFTDTHFKNKTLKVRALIILIRLEVTRHTLKDLRKGEKPSQRHAKETNPYKQR